MASGTVSLRTKDTCCRSVTKNYGWLLWRSRLGLRMACVKLSQRTEDGCCRSLTKDKKGGCCHSRAKD
jgi:hypothetical protein